MDKFRSVIYLQAPEQREKLFINKQQKKIGFEAQQELRFKYKESKTKLPYEQWCLERDNLPD
ncbi:hypothetical protein ACJJI3_12680 [Microbulbifer sp. ZKSA004]|uniref:hypothetical protein n=1 Tax=Microbulbifer sp. ZKSA004 TaxID=3243389 RepID=UPI004038FC84